MLAHAFRSHRSAVRRLVVRISGEQGADDVVQDVFVRLWCSQDSFDPARGTIRQYLLTVSRGLAIDRARSHASARAREERTASAERYEPEPAAAVIGEERASRVVDALARLPRKQRDAIVTTFYGELSYRSAAALLGVAEGTMKSQIRMGLRNLRRELHDLVP